MDIRERLNKNPAIGIAGAAIVIFAILIESYFYLVPGTPTFKTASDSTAPAYFTTDDGATWFTDAGTRVPPFDRNGKPAVKAFVYMCGGTTVVKCLEKFSAGPYSPLLVKEPGKGDWIPDSDPAAAELLHPKCPDGSTPVQMFPAGN